MNLAVVNEAVTGMNGVEHEFTEEEKNFVLNILYKELCLTKSYNFI